MSNVVMELDEKLKRWDAATSQEVADLVSQIIEWADQRLAGFDALACRGTRSTRLAR
jgi:hypothetical protein